jgi:hypothetical protein
VISLRPHRTLGQPSEQKEKKMPNILHEFYTLTKGMEYLIVIVYLFLFISFWRFLTYKEKD